MRMLLARDEALPQKTRTGAQSRNTLPLCFPSHDPTATVNPGALVGCPFFLIPRNQFFGPVSLVSFRFPLQSSLKFGKGEGRSSSIPCLSPSCLLPTPQKGAELASKSKVNICCFPVESGDSESRMGRVNRKKGGRRKSHKRHSVQFQGTEKSLDGQLPSP